jgi:hypothetical protein
MVFVKNAGVYRVGKRLQEFSKPTSTCVSTSIPKDTINYGIPPYMAIKT